jgi:hypothetical protein
MKFVKFSLLLILPMTLSGCFGLAVGSYGKHERLVTSFALAKGKNTFGGSVHPGAYSESDIVRLWGEPDGIATNDCCEVLSYNAGWSWSGVGAFVIVVPVPLLVPSGHYANRFYFKDGKCVGLVSEYGEVSLAMPPTGLKRFPSIFANSTLEDAA